MKKPIPEWVTRGKTIRELIRELQSFEDQDLEVRMSLEHGSSHGSNHHAISLVERRDGRYCVLTNAEAYYSGEWQSFGTEDEVS